MLFIATRLKTISRNEFDKVEVQTPQDGEVKVFTLTKINGHWAISNILTDQLAANDLPVNKRPAAAATKGADIPAKPVVTPLGGVKDPNVAQ